MLLMKEFLQVLNRLSDDYFLLYTNQIMISDIYIFCKYYWFLFLLCIVFLIFGIILEYLNLFSNYTISSKKVIDIINHDNGVILDLRMYSDYQISHIINSKNYKLENLIKSSQSKSYIDKYVILVLDKNYNCRNILQKLKLNNFKNIKCLKQGISGWKSNNLPLIKSI